MPVLSGVKMATMGFQTCGKTCKSREDMNKQNQLFYSKKDDSQVVMLD